MNLNFPYKKGVDEMPFKMPFHKSKKASKFSEDSKKMVEAPGSSVSGGKTMTLLAPTETKCAESNSGQEAGGFLQHPNQLLHYAERRNSIGTTNSSPTDPAYVPTTSRSATGEQSSQQNQLSTHNTDMSAVRTETRSYFDETSDSDISEDEDLRPVMRRASSVRFTKPNIVLQSPAKISFNAKVYNESLSHRSHLPLEDSSQVLPAIDEDKNVSTITKGMETGLNKSHDGELSTAQSDILTAHQPQNSSTDPVSSNSGSITKEKDFFAEHPTIRIVSNSSENLDRLSGAYYGHSKRNDVGKTALEAFEQRGLSRSATSPLPSPRSNRRVTIRPPNIATGTYTKKQPGFRESIVSTPYPGYTSVNFGASKITEPSSLKEDRHATGAQSARTRSDNEEVSGKQYEYNLAIPPLEVLFLDLVLAKHPCARISLEIQISDKAIFDDETLFHQIRKAYFRQLLGVKRLPFTLIRVVTNATATLPLTVGGSEFDTSDFLLHFKNPSLGRKRKGWVSWLRKHSRARLSPKSVSTFDPEGTFLLNSSRKVDKVTSLSLRSRASSAARSPPTSTRKSGHDRSSVIDNGNEKSNLASTSNTSSLRFVFPQMKVPRMPFENTTRSSALPEICQSFFRRSSVGEECPKPVVITLHHSFSFSMISCIVVCTIIWSIAATILWIVFGVPRSTPHGKDRSQPGEVSVLSHLGHYHVARDWSKDAHPRVLTGLVLGLAVLLIGVVVDAGIACGGWLLV